jgi:hypothetical protein
MPPRTPVTVSPPPGRFLTRLSQVVNTAAATGRVPKDAELERTADGLKLLAVGELADQQEISRVRRTLGVTRQDLADLRKGLGMPPADTQRTSMPREDVIEALAVLGFDAAQLTEVTIQPHTIVARSIDADGRPSVHEMRIDRPKPKRLPPTIAQPGPEAAEEF